MNTKLMTLFAALIALTGISCSSSPPGFGGTDTDTDTDTDSDSDVDSDTDADTDSDSDTDVDTDSDTDTDSDSDSDTDTGAGACPYECVWVFTCSGTVHDEYTCDIPFVQECCESTDTEPEPDGGSSDSCPWTCESYIGGCTGIGHPEYTDCGMNVCCEPASLDGGTGDCEDEGYSCTAVGYPPCGGDAIHFELGGCEMFELCCE